MTRKQMEQYWNLKQESIEVAEKIEKLKKEIKRTESSLEEIHVNGTVKDKVYGGLGGTQGFVIEGYPASQYERLKSTYHKKIKLLKEQEEVLEWLQNKINTEIVEIEKFLSTISDSYIRRIINMRFVLHMTWGQIAVKIGGGNTEDSVRKTYERYIDKKTID